MKTRAIAPIFEWTMAFPGGGDRNSGCSPPRSCASLPSSCATSASCRPRCSPSEDTPTTPSRCSPPRSARCGPGAPRASERARVGGLRARAAGRAAGDIYSRGRSPTIATRPYPSFADVGYLGFFPAAFAGLVLLLRARATELVVAGSGSTASSVRWRGRAIGAALVLDLVASADGSLGTVATNLAYPLADLMMLVVRRRRLVVAGAGRLDVAAARRRPRGLGHRRRDLPLQVGGRDLRGVHAAGHDMAAVRTCWSRSRRAARPTGWRRAAVRPGCSWSRLVRR